MCHTWRHVPRMTCPHAHVTCPQAQENSRKGVEDTEVTRAETQQLVTSHTAELAAAESRFAAHAQAGELPMLWIARVLALLLTPLPGLLN